MLSDEQEAILAVYCLPGECQIIGNLEKCSTYEEVTVNMMLNQESAANTPYYPVKLVLTVPAVYPDSPPQISILSEHLSRDCVRDIKEKTSEFCKELIGDAMLISLITFVREQLESVQEDNALISQNLECSTNAETLNNVWTSVLHIDHMRSKTKYCKTLDKWISELGLCGRLVFCSKIILLILQGERNTIHDFVVRLKTACVDVDSRGHACKERMMSVLCEIQLPLTQTNRFMDYQQCEMKNCTELEELLTEAGLTEIYKEYILVLFPS
ncbi:RWD domain-containing protein 3-like isoform X2 [Mya arenaria]|uniref:RWD domain-containing protein 3-like isoform X2 n=1 Tax=Mya arenaria TaxID=6604 RepID=UPI0022E71D96|nr:RWD domain-containing protein 3-like isoform X2 [Mya arenaria]